MACVTPLITAPVHPPAPGTQLCANMLGMAASSSSSFCRTPCKGTSSPLPQGAYGSEVSPT
eukprot:1507653-Pyramimonas_sp.AAC.1